MASSRHAMYNCKPTDSYSAGTTNDDCVKVLGIGGIDLLFPSDGQPYIFRLDPAVLVEALASVFFSPQAMEKAGHKLETYDGCVTLFDGRLQFRVEGNLCKHFADRFTRRYVRNAMKEFGDDDDDDTFGETSSGGEVAKAAVLALSHATSSVTTSRY